MYIFIINFLRNFYLRKKIQTHTKTTFKYDIKMGYSQLYNISIIKLLYLV